MRRTLPVFAVTIVAAAWATGCGTTDSEKSLATETSIPVLDQYTDEVEIADFYDFEAVTLDGDRIEGDDLRDKQLALWFWTPW